MNKNWYAVYTKPQCEKKVVAQLFKKRIDSFAPVNVRYSGNGNRRKLVTEQLFPSFVFVYITDAEITTVRQTNDVINFVYWLGKPAVIKAAEIENIQYFTDKFNDIELIKIPVNPGGIVRISNIPKHVSSDEVFTAVNTIKVTLPSLGYMMQVEAEIASTEIGLFNTENANLII